MTPTLVYVVEDDEAVRDGLAFLLLTAGLDGECFESANAFLEVFDMARPGCIVTDVRLPGLNGLELLGILRQRGSKLPVIVMTAQADIPLAVEAMKGGAVDFIEKPFSDERLLSSVRSALGQYRLLGQADTELGRTRSHLRSLTAREAQVLDGLLAGRTNKVIAFDLDLSPRTVEIYRANVMAKMQAASLSELVRKVLLVRASSDAADD